MGQGVHLDDLAEAVVLDQTLIREQIQGGLFLSSQNTLHGLH